MTAITTSFFTEIEQSLLDAIIADCGPGSILYDGPDYMYIQTARRGQVVPIIDFGNEPHPVLTIQYAFQDDIEGAQTGADSFLHRWNIGIYAHWTNNELEMIAPTDIEFRTAISASAGVLMKRVRKAMRLATLNADDDFGEVQGIMSIPRAAYWPRRLGAYDYEVEILYELSLTTEIEEW